MMATVVWLSWLLAYLEEKNKISIVKPLSEILLRLQKLEEKGGKALEKEIAKSRKRAGVGNVYISTFFFI